ncbi:MAG: hypothetical protein WBN95_04915 [Gammaproteobacteria bacterium]
MESLCQHGCERVSAYIALLRTGEVFAEVANLSEIERQLVLDELVAIMAPYEEKGNC